MIRNIRPQLVGTASHRFAVQFSLIMLTALIFAVLAVAAIVPSAAHAAFGVTGFSVTSNTKQAGAHPNLTVAFNRGEANTEDLRDVTIDYPNGLQLNPEAAVSKCTSTQFAADLCPSSSVVGDFTVNANLEILTFSVPATANGTIYVLAPSGLENATLGYVLRPSGYAKTFARQVITVKSDSDGGPATITTNSLRTQALTWPRLWGSTNIAVRKLTLRYNARANANKTGPYFTLNPASCTASSVQLSAVSYASETAGSTVDYTATGCATAPFTPTMNIAVDNPNSGQYTGSTFTVNVPQTDVNIQHSPVKSISAQLPLGTDLNTSLLATYGTGCLEAELLSDVCPEGALVGDATASFPFFPPGFSGEVYVMSPVGAQFNGAIVLRGPRNMKSIMRFGNTVSGGRVVSNWSYMPHVPFSQLQVHISEPLLKNPNCPGAAQTSSATLTAYSLRTRSVSPAYTTICPTTVPAPPAIVTPPTGTLTSDSTPTFSGTAVASTTVTFFDGATNIGTTTANASGNWTFTPAASIGSGASTITATATNGSGTSGPSPAVVITVDTLAPTVPVITTDGGATNDNTPTIGGTAEESSTVVIYNGASALGSTTANSSGIWSFTTATLANGAYSITATATDAAGNTSAATAAQAMTVDTVAPAAPAITSPANGSSTGDSTPTISGTAEASTVVRVTRSGNTLVCSATAAANGQWTCTAAAGLPDGSYSITAVATDAATNASPASTAISFTVAQVVPIQITTGPEGGLPIDVTHLPWWYQGGVNPLTGATVTPHPAPQWNFTGAVGAQYQCSLVKASQADSFSSCTAPFTAPFESLDDTVIPAGTNYRFVVRYATDTTISDTALFKVGTFDPTWNVSMSTYQAMAHPDMTVTASNPFGDVMSLYASTPDHFWGSLSAITQKCTIVSAQSGTCATTAPNSKIGSITFTADVDPNPHNDTVPPHQVTRTYDTYLTPATRAGDAAGVAISIRAIDEVVYGSRDYGTINYIGRLKLRYSENVVHPDEIEQSYTGVNDPTGMDLWLENIPNSTLSGPGVITGPAGAADLHVRSITATVLGNAPWYAAPLTWNDSQCDVAGSFEASIISTSYNPVQQSQPYQATGCENLAYDPAITQFSVSDNGATDLINDLNIGVSFPAGNATTRSAIVDMPREFVANAAAVQACTSANVMVADPQANCPDTANLGTATATSPLLPYPLVGDVIGEDVGGTLPNIYMVFKDSDIGLDTRIRGSAEVLKTGTSGGQAQGDFIRTRMNLGSDGGPLDLPSMPLTSLVLNLHQENPGTVLPDGTTSLGSIIKVATGYACNSTASARFILNSWSGVTRQLVSPATNFNCAANGQTVANTIGVVSGPANGQVITTDSVTFVLQNNYSGQVRLRTGIDDGTYALDNQPFDANIEPGISPTPTTNAGATRSVTYSGLQDGKVYKFLVQNTAPGAALDQERRTFKVQLSTGPNLPPAITSPVNGLSTNVNTVPVGGTADPSCTVIVYDGAAALGSTSVTAGGNWSFITGALSDGSHALTATCNTFSGTESSPSNVRTVTVDTVPPTAPQITSPTDAQTGTVTNVVGTAEPASTVTVREGATVVCSATTNASGGWICTPGTPFSNSNHVICATATDAASNTGVSDCVQFGDASAAKARILTGPEGGLPIDITHDLAWYNAGHQDPKWSFEGGGAGATYQCSLVKAALADSFSACTSPFQTPFNTLDDTVPAGTDYRFRVRINGLAASVDTALFKVGQFNPTWNVGLSTYQALAHPDMTITVASPFGDALKLVANTPDYFMGSLSANPVKCSIDSAQAGTCATTAPVSKIGSITFTADVNPNPHNDTVPPHQVQRTFDAYLTPALIPGDAAGIAVSIRAIDDAAYGSLDYGTINYIGRMKLRYDGPGGAINYLSVSNPRGMQLIIDDIPNSTLPASGVTSGPAGAADLHVRGVTAEIAGTSFDYASPLLYNSSDCSTETGAGAFTADVTSAANNAPAALSQSYLATGCENIEYEPSIIQFGVSDNGATDLVNDITVGVFFPEGNATTRSAVVDMPREFVANIPAVEACPSASVMVEDPQASCSDRANLGTATATSPLLPYSLTGDIIGEDSGGSLPNLYMVFKDPDIGLDTRIRGSASVLKTGTSTGQAQGDFIRTTMNLRDDGSPMDLPSLPLTSLVLNLHQEDAGAILPDGSTSLGPIVKVGTTYACNDTAAARFIMKSWSGVTARLMSSVLNFNCAANGQTVTNQVGINSGPANGEIVTTSSVTFVLQNNHTLGVRLRTGLDDGTNAETATPYDANIEPNALPTPTTATGATRTVTYTGLEDGKVYKFLAQNNASGSALDQERRTFKVDLP